MTDVNFSALKYITARISSNDMYVSICMMVDCTIKLETELLSNFCDYMEQLDEKVYS